MGEQSMDDFNDELLAELHDEPTLQAVACNILYEEIPEKKKKSRLLK